DADVIVLVTEPTPFGVFDLGLAHKAFAPMGKPMGVVVNRAGVGTDEVYHFCRRNGLEIFAEIPYDRAIAEAYAEGRIVAEAVPSAGEILSGLGDRLRRLVGDSSAKEASRV
ncbi:MAG: (4Fe-4S)-binding protein, partial [Desulfobacteraceae bacterium]|nr:(4Fe-4S)-binding protein [Desulfobacteraceae bacterium]